MMALQLGALRDALLDAGASSEKADRASEDLAGYDNRFDAVDRRLADFGERITSVEGKVSLPTWMVGFNLAMTLAILWRVFAHEQGRRLSTASSGTLERRAYALLYAGFRPGDAARVGRVGRQHVQKDGTLAIRTEKTGALVAIDIAPPLQRALEAGPHGRPEVLNVLTAVRGDAWGKKYLGRWFGERDCAIGLDRTAHALRKAAARRYAERGATVPQLMALFG